MQWLDSVAGPGYAAALLWTFAALILLVIVLVIIRLVRNLTFGTFVAGGRNRKTRLAVMVKPVPNSIFVAGCRR